MDFLELAREARTCRRFIEAEPLSFNDLEWLIECARLAPCAGNAQKLRYITVNQGPVCQQLFAMTRWAAALKDWDGPGEGERPGSFIAVLMPENGGNLLCYDVGIACQTIQLAASSRGWGACIMYSFDHKKACELLSVPQDMTIALLVALGRAAEKRVVENMPADGSFAYWHDENNVNHVPKRSVQELLLARF